MSSIQERTVRRNHGDEPITEELRVSDWLGLTGYLAEAVANDRVTVDLAREEMVGSATDTPDTRALIRAASVAANELGTDALVTTLLHAASSTTSSPTEAMP